MTTATRAASAPAARTDVLFAAIAAFALGAILVFGTGFAAPDALHSATHDTRHAMGLPCH